MSDEVLRLWQRLQVATHPPVNSQRIRLSGAELSTDLPKIYDIYPFPENIGTGLHRDCDNNVQINTAYSSISFEPGTDELSAFSTK